MNTLQKVSELEQKVATIEHKMKVFESLAATAPKVAQDTAKLAADLNTVIKAIQNITDGVNKRTRELADMDNMVITKLMGLEQASASISKMVAALVAQLSAAHGLDQVAIMDRLRKADEESDKEQIQQMIKMKVIEPSAKVSEDSVIVVSQKFTPADTAQPVDVVGEYRSLNLANPEIEKETKSNYVGKSQNDVIELNLEDGVLTTTILEVYDYVKVYAQGESSPETEAPPSEPAVEAAK